MSVKWETAVIVCDLAENSIRIIEEAILLAKSQTENIEIVVPIISGEDNRILKELNYGDIKINQIPAKQKWTDVEATLNQYNLKKRILFIPLSFRAEVITFQEEKFRNLQSEKSNWGLIIGDFSRVAFLGTHNSQNDYVPQDTKSWLRNLLKTYSKETLIEFLSKTKNLKIAVIGETIIDEYIFCESLGKVSKDPLIAFNRMDSIKQSGGIVAIAKHLSSFASEVWVHTEINTKYLEFIESSLPSNVFLEASTTEKNSCTLKTRFLEVGSNLKLFETYELGNIERASSGFNSILTGDSKNPENRWTELTSYDGVIVVDYGHGLLNDNDSQKIVSQSRNLSVNTQTNAGNRGFNPISKYNNAKRMFVNGNELELELRKKSQNRMQLVDELAPILGCSEFFVTQGSAGLIYWTPETGAHQVPGFAPNIIDKVGAGDALLSIISVLRMANIPIEVACFFGNIAGALLVGGIGNQVVLTHKSLLTEANEILSKIEESI